MYKETEGILITIYKDVQENNQNVNLENNARTEIPNILWSYYDRISIKKVKEMREYLFMQQEEPKFVGNVQSFHLYRKIENEKDKVFDYERDNTQEALLVSGEKKWAYFALTLIRLNDEITDYIQNYDTRGAFNLSEIANDISECIHNKMCPKDDMAFEIYNSLGSEDFVIVMASNSLNNIRNAIELIRKIRFKSSSSEKENQYLIETTHTIAGINCSKEIDAACSEEGVRASIRLTLKNTEEGERYWKEFKSSLLKNACQVEVRNKGHQLFGAHDVEIDIPIDQNFLRLYEKTGCLNAENPKYKEALYQSQTIIYFEGKERKKEKAQKKKYFLSDKLNNDIVERIKQIRQIEQPEQRIPQAQSKYDDLKKAIERIGIMDDTSAFGVEMRIFFSEYEQNNRGTMS